MRVIAGSAGGLRLQTVKGTGTRPTADRAKEFFRYRPADRRGAMLDLLLDRELGYRALSRGAQHAVFVTGCRLALR